jgi:hypothetical protein
MTETLTALDGLNELDLAPGTTPAALTVAPLLRPGLAELGVSAALDPKASCQLPGSSVDRSVAEIATDGAPACVELKGAS